MPLGFVPMIEIGPIIARRRAELGVSQKSVAEALGISATYLCDMELGRRPFPANRVGSLPPEIRQVVAEAIINARNEEIADLRRFVEDAV